MGGVTQLTEESASKAEAAIKALGAVRKSSTRTWTTASSTSAADAEARARQQVKQAVEDSGIGVQEVRELGAAQGGGFDYQVVASRHGGQGSRRAEATGLAQAGLRGAPRWTTWARRWASSCATRASMALLYAMVAILIYVAFRFDFKFGPGALVAMVHDVIMVAGYFLVTPARVQPHLDRRAAHDRRLLDQRHHRDLRPHPRGDGQVQGQAAGGDHQHRRQRHAGAHHPHLGRDRAVADRSAHLRRRRDLGLRRWRCWWASSWARTRPCTSPAR